MSAAIAIAFRRASFAYGSTPVLSEVDLTVRPGELVGVLGANGSGKTTLIRGATGVLSPTHGSVIVLDRPLAEYDRRSLACSLAVVPQEGAPPFSFTVLETVLMGRFPWMAPFEFESADDVAIARDAIRAVGVEDLEDRDLSELSGGERQRVIIARALAQGTSVLLADEPTAHLDLRHAVAIFGLLGKLSREHGLAILLVTHDVNQAAIHCDRLALLSDRSVLREGRPEEVLTRDALERAFQTRVSVERRPDGTPFVVPGAATRE